MDAAAGSTELAGRNRRRAGRRRRREGGAALVEFALIAPVLFLVLFGIIEFGLGLNDYQSIRHGVRDGARQAVVQQFGAADGSCTTLDAPADVKRIVCITEERIGLGADVRVRVRYDMTGAGTGGNFGTVEVCAQRKVDPLTGAIPMIDGIDLKSSIEMRMESALRDVDADGTPDVREHPDFPTFAEDLRPDQGWSGC